MVNIEELMYGNYIVTKNGVEDVCHIAGYCEENKPRLEQLSTNKNIGWLNIPHYCFPIEITKEWIEKLGFEYYEPLDHWRIIYNECWYEINGRDGFYWLTFSNLLRDEYRSMPDRKVQYVHQLQNLFYCLSGRKLKLID